MSAAQFPPRQPDQQKEQRIQREREMLLSQLAAKEMKSIRARVAFILNHYPDTRNTDKDLAWKYWKTFQPNVLGPDDNNLTIEKLRRLDNYNSLTRSRQKIQNEYGLFPASIEVAEARREKELDYREQMVFDQPGTPLVTVYCDESGKSGGEWALVGSMWLYDSFQGSRFIKQVVELKSRLDVKGEFHFSRLSSHMLEPTKAFFAQALSLSDTMCYKAIAVRRNGLNRPIGDVITELHYQLVLKGLKHEFEGRLSPPRVVEVFKDKEDGMDALHKERLTQQLEVAFKDHFGQDASLEFVESVESSRNYLIQLADIFTGSVNRALNPQGEGTNHKDALADFVLSSLGLTINRDGTVHAANQDMATIMFLS